MKVLYVQPGGGIGGSKISLYHILKCAPASQISYLVLSAPGDEGYEELVKNYAAMIIYLELPTWQKYRCRTWLEKLRAPFGNLLRLLKLIPVANKIKQIIKREGIDLVHTNNSISAAGAMGAWLAKIPHVWHIREPFGSKRQYLPILGDAITYWLIDKLSNSIICNSWFTAQLFHERQIPHVIIENGVDIEEFLVADPKGKTLRTSLGVQPGELVIGMVGNLTTQWKGHNIFLELAATLNHELSNIRFIIFGGSKNLAQTDYTRSLLHQVSALGIDGIVTWADFIPDTGAIMNSLDILVHPALTEGSGRVIMEAMAVGKPVVAMKSGGAQELVQDGLTGFLIQPGDLSAMAEKVKSLIENKVMREIMGENARAYAQKHFSDRTSMTAIVDVYHNLV